MKIEQVMTSDIPVRSSNNTRYDELFEMVLNLEVGRGVCVTTEGREKPICVANCIRDRLKTRHIAKKYIIAIRNKNTIYFGRTE